jgi:hypothetical protein
MEWKNIKKHEARELISSWQFLNQVEYNPTDSFISCRIDLLEIFNCVKQELRIDSPNHNEYKVDFTFGLKFYTYLRDKLEITESIASDNGFWVFLSVKVIPDVVFWRWGPNAHDRFYGNSRRIWLKVLWWYIHLSWQGSYQSTYSTIINNTTDEIVQMVERSGSYGYRIKLCRVIMKHYGQYEPSLKTRHTKLFRRAMKLNTAMLEVIEPALYEGEEEGYVQDLFGKFVQKK